MGGVGFDFIVVVLMFALVYLLGYANGKSSTGKKQKDFEHTDRF